MNAPPIAVLAMNMVMVDLNTYLKGEQMKLQSSSNKFTENSAVIINK